MIFRRPCRCPRFPRFLCFVLAALFAFLLPGCAGYHVGPVKPRFMGGINSIAIPTFRNATLIPRIEVLVSDTVIRQFQQDGTYKIASSPDTADAILEGEITDIRRRPDRSVIGDVQSTEEFNMTLTIHYKVIRRATGETVDERTVSGNTEFFVSGDVNQDERQAIPLATQNAAISLVSELSEGW
jgi:hypothetical protein